MSQGLLNGSILDYGCGKCHEINNNHFKADGYDPHYRPDGINQQSYDVILCNFVLNTIESVFERVATIQRIRKLLSPDGVAYISVRNDKKKLNGFTSRRTWQGFVIPPGELIKECASYRMYRLTKFRQ
jgi:hypothetical protein